MSFILGGSLMVTTDLIARTVISPSELPVGAITALIGAPFFAWVYFSGRRKTLTLKTSGRKPAAARLSGADK
jgi:iron complex transport system permease protein